MTDTMTDDVERVARAIEQRTIELQGEGKLVVHGYNDSVAFAHAALAAIRETHAIVPKGKLIEGQLALSNWQKYNRPDGYDEVVYQAEKMAASLSAMIAAAEEVR